MTKYLCSMRTFYPVLLWFAFVLVLADAARIRRVILNAGDISGAITFKKLAIAAKLGDQGTLKKTTNQLIPSAKGVNRWRLTQTFNNLDVFGASAIAEVDEYGRLTGQLYGPLAMNIEQDIPGPNVCQKNIDTMVNFAIRQEGFSLTDRHIDKTDGRRVVYIDIKTIKAHLAYRVEFLYTNNKHASYPVYFIDACTSKVLAAFNQIQNASLDRFPRQEDECQTDTTSTTTTTTTQSPIMCEVDAAGLGGNLKTGRRVYNSWPLCLNVRTSNSENTCHFENTYVRVIDNEKSTDRRRTRVAVSECSQGYQDAVNGAYGVASDAMYFGDITGRLYVEKYNVRALPYSPRLVIHYGNCYDNAFWDGTDMYFGDGCSYFHPLVNQDVTAHELAHGITSRNSNLEYRYQSGGINEAFSDISGEVAEVFGRSSNDWVVGAEIFKNNGALRYFINPPDDGRSIKHVRDYRSGMDVHYSSGIFNHAFYQLVAVQNMAIYSAYECFLKANLGIWRSTTGFTEGACGVMQACYDAGHDLDKVRNAFSVVGIGLGDCDYDVLTTVMSFGTRRRNILVSKLRNPILKVKLAGASKFVIRAQVSDRSRSRIQIEMSTSASFSDSGSTKRGINSLTVSGNRRSHVFVRLKSDDASDVKVTLRVN